MAFGVRIEDDSSDEIVETIMHVRWNCRRGRTDPDYEHNHLLLNDLLDGLQEARAREALASQVN